MPEAVYNEGVKSKGLIVILCAVCAAGIIAALLLQRSHPGAKRASRHAAKKSARAHPARPALVNKAAYNTKMREIANLPPPIPCISSHDASAAAAGASAKVAVEKDPRSVEKLKPAVYVKKKPKLKLKPCRAPLWPVHAAYPDAGALLPFKRVVAYYGNFYSKRMGVLGEYPPDKMLAMLAEQSAAWAKADPSTPVVPAVDYIVVAAQSKPGKDGMYRMRMPKGQIEKALGLAERIHGLLFLDVQPGWSSVQSELPRLEPYLKRANVELALDPEFALVSGRRPGAYIGTMGAGEINYAARFLARIARENHLPPKILVVHRFTQRMLTDSHAIRPLGEVQIVIDMDGFGSPVLKRSTYGAYVASQPVQFTGFKLFYKNDVKVGGQLMTPREVLRLSPQPSFILYQ